MRKPGRKPAKGKRTTQGKRSNSVVTVLVLAVLLAGLSFRLYHLFQDLLRAQAEESSYAAQLAELQETNQRLSDDIANQNDIGLIEDIARNELGMAAPGEKILRFSK